MARSTHSRTLLFSRFIGSLLAAVLVLSGSSLAKADAGKEAEGYFKRKNAEVQALLKKKPSKSRQKKLSTLLDGLLDYTALSKASLGKRWDDLNESQRTEFVQLLQALVSQNYRKNLETTASYALRYTGHETKGKKVLVKTVAKSKTDKRAASVELDYWMVRSGGSWKVVDIITDGVSLVTNYKRQFRRIIKKEGFDGLIKKMQAKLEE